MRKIDYHMHTRFSADSEASPREHIEEAIKKGLNEICFTDHKDFEYPFMPFDHDASLYFLQLKQLVNEYKDKICIKIGLEIGLDMNYINEINHYIESNDYDYVIGSIHVISKQEFYDPADFFKNKTKEQAHLDFFNETLTCVQTFDCFNCLGHLDYICRYGPYVDKQINYDQCNSLIDEILKTLISKGKGIEINTSGYALRDTAGFPNYDIVQRYYDLGGRIITVGTDSHTSDRVGQHVEDVNHHLSRIGFDDVTTFTKQKIDKE